MAKSNVTLKLDADLLREARVLAAEAGRSLSALLTERLEAMIRERKAFEKARRRALARLREGLELQWTPPRSRDELHER
ncbi:MAG TPA: type II toxin-antitoxin system CcdA family antitoxin [Vicinamibacteria bacterium]|nr:type II toxin-antitoxin system CcdA family antitoxin [Vicinamibacteria bacterium]